MTLIFAEIPIISGNGINYGDVMEHDLGQLFVDVSSSRFSFGGRVWLHVG